VRGERQKHKEQEHSSLKGKGAAEVQDRKKMTGREVWRCKALRRKAVSAGVQGT